MKLDEMEDKLRRVRLQNNAAEDKFEKLIKRNPKLIAEFKKLEKGADIFGGEYVE